MAREGHVALIGDGGRRRKLLAAGDDDALVGLLDHVEGEVLLLDLAPLVLGLGAAVDLRVAEGVGQEEVVLAAQPGVVDDVLREVAVGVLDLREHVSSVVEHEDVGREDVRATAHLPPGLLVPDLTVAALQPRLVQRLRDEPRQADAVARVLRDVGHLVAVLVRVLQVVDAGKLVDHRREGRVGGDVVNLLAVEKDLPAVLEALDEALAGHCAFGSCGIQYHCVLL